MRDEIGKFGKITKAENIVLFGFETTDLQKTF